MYTRPSHPLEISRVHEIVCKQLRCVLNLELDSKHKKASNFFSKYAYHHFYDPEKGIVLTLLKGVLVSIG